MAWRLLCLLCLLAGGEAFLSGATGLGGTMRLHRFRGGGPASACGSGSGIAIEAAPKIELNDKTLHPMIGYGTYKVSDGASNLSGT